MKKYYRCPICHEMSNGGKCNYCKSRVEDKARLRHNKRLLKEEILMKLLTTHEIAAIISERTGYPMSVRQVQREIINGHIKAEKFGHTYLAKESALNHYKRRHRGSQ